MTNISAQPISKGLVVLGLHHADAKELFPQHVIRAGYEPVSCHNVETILDVLGRTEVHACIMDLNFEQEKHKRLNNPEPGKKIVDFLRARGDNISETYMGLSSNAALVEAAHGLLIPGYKYLVDFVTERHRVAAFLNRDGHFTPSRFPTEPEALKDYYRKISGL